MLHPHTRYFLCTYKVKNRTLRVGFVSLFASISVPIGSALSGVLFRDYGFYGVYIISTVLYLSIFVYGIFVIKDVGVPDEPKENGVETKIASVDRVSVRSTVADFFDLKHVKESFRVTFKRGKTGNRRLDIVLMFIIIVIVSGPLTGMYNTRIIILLYSQIAH